MTNRKVKGPSHFCEWVVGTTIESALGPIPKNKPPKKRDVVRVEVTTDDESEEDTVKITYPRTGRTNTPPPTISEAKTTIKKVRFEDGPIKSALKQTVITTPIDSSDETSDSGSELETESSQSETTLSSDATDSDAESSEDSFKSKPKKKKKRKQKQIEADTESDWDSDPDPTCKCRRCTKGREILKRIGKKKSKEDTTSSPETSESEEENPPKHKHQSGKNKKKGAKKEKEPETESETSDSVQDTSESEQETAPPKKKQRSNKQQQPKKQGKQKGKKKQQIAPESETSESEPEPPKSKKQQKREAKKAAKKEEEPEPEEDAGETSESAKETEDEADPEESPKQQSKGKQKNNNNNKQKQTGKQAGKANQQSNKKKQKAGKESNKEPEAAEEVAAEEEVPATSKEHDQGKLKNVKGKGKAQSRYRDGVKKGNYPEGLPVPHMRRPQLIEPIRAQVVQTERVIETPEDPAPNAYYDAEHNVMRVYHGPVYGNHQNNALYPDRSAFNRPLPMGQPHPLQNPFYHGFNNPQQYPNYPQMSPYHQNFAGVPPPEAYSHVPITQGMTPPWYATGGPPGFYPSNSHHEKPHYGKTGNSSQDKDRGSHNNVGPPASLTGQNNPYLPKKNRSQFSAWGGSHRSVSKEKSQPPGSVKAASADWNDNSNNNNDTGNGWNDGAGDNNTQKDQSGWDTGGQDNNQNGNDWGVNDNQASADWNNPAPEAKQDDTWAPAAPRDSAQQDQNAGWGSGSNKSNETVRKAGDHWGEDTYPGASGSWDEQPKDAVSSLGQGADNNVGVWDTGKANRTEQPASSQGENGPDNVMPGTWVETPAVTAGPSWGDSSAAQETNGRADHW
ncbi:Ff.00g081970.m01.CDS01 [Fusarium sp. VM40]|nr:Ff.00g081970.m01.CDS01 [Fusarium sp. VM40]